MNRYILYTGRNYYPSGYDDYRGTFGSVELAKHYIYSAVSIDREWYEIIYINDTGMLILIESGNVVVDGNVTRLKPYS